MSTNMSRKEAAGFWAGLCMLLDIPSSLIRNRNINRSIGLHCPPRLHLQDYLPLTSRANSRLGPLHYSGRGPIALDIFSGIYSTNSSAMFLLDSFAVCCVVRTNT